MLVAVAAAGGGVVGAIGGGGGTDSTKEIILPSPHNRVNERSRTVEHDRVLE